MQYSEGSVGRIFALKLDEGERVPDVIEEFAREQDIRSAMVLFLGGVADGSRLVVGPEKQMEEKIVPITHVLSGVQEVLGMGTLFLNQSGHPILHMHAATGREGGATVGCTRAGVEVWLIGEVIIMELLGLQGRREKDTRTGFELLQLPKAR
ncbi:MAG: DUF296 domain-containing protein [Desulforhabdus sp.]|jgi:predicted DNA-binding protein with PD1-like motif|nr:DUF296 domain-containing protein [Desulforhabdus sp.]